MSLNGIHKLAPKKPEIESGQVSSIPIEFLILPGEQVSVVAVETKRQTGGVISAKNFPSR